LVVETVPALSGATTKASLVACVRIQRDGLVNKLGFHPHKE